MGTRGLDRLQHLEVKEAAFYAVEFEKNNLTLIYSIGVAILSYHKTNVKKRPSTKAIYP